MFTWKVKDPPDGCSAPAMTDTLLHSTVRRSGRESREMVDELERLGSSWGSWCQDEDVPGARSLASEELHKG